MTQYEIVEVHALPSFDPSKAVKHVLLSPANVVRANRVLHTYGSVVTVCYFAGMALFPVLLFGRADVATFTCALEVVLEVPSYITSILALRADLLKLLVTSYDYWFFSATTVLFTVSFSLLARDWRVVLISSRWLGFQVPILIDALMVQRRSMVHAVMLNVVLIALGLGAIGLHLTNGLATVEIAVSSRHSLSMRDLLVNTMVTMEILLLRITIRKYEALRAPKRPSAEVIVKCVTIRCAIKLQALPTPPAREQEKVIVDATTPIRRQPSKDRRAVQLRRTLSNEVYDSESILATSLLQYGWSLCFKIVLQATGYMAVGLTGACCFLSFPHDTSRIVPVAMAAVCAGAVATTAMFVGTYVLFSNRRLLYRLWLSFDFIFLSLQITAAHVSFCDMLYGRLAPCATLVCTWFWIHWVITLDALTPAAKEWLGFHHRLVVLVITLYFAGQVGCCAGLLWDRWDVQSRVILSTKLLGHTIEFTVLPFFASRLLTISVWTLRLLWRVCYEPDPDKLLLLRGQVEFELEKTHRAPSAAALTQVVPFAEPSRRSPTDTQLQATSS